MDGKDGWIDRGEESEKEYSDGQTEDHHQPSIHKPHGISVRKQRVLKQYKLTYKITFLQAYSLTDIRTVSDLHTAAISQPNTLHRPGTYRGNSSPGAYHPFHLGRHKSGDNREVQAIMERRPITEDKK